MEEKRVSFKEAIAQERAAWRAVQDRLPGSPAHDAALWRKWMSAAEQVTKAPVTLDLDFGHDSQLAELPDADAGREVFATRARAPDEQARAEHGQRDSTRVAHKERPSAG